MPEVLITATGAGSWTVPAGVTSVYAEVWAGTGGGQYGTGSGGGAYSASTISVTPGQVISYYVAQALPYPQSGAKVIGQDSWVGSASTVMAKGSDGPYGGKADQGYGTIKFSGGDAEYAVPEFGTPPTVDYSYARAGGGAASPSGNGQPGRYNPYTDASVGGDSPGAGQGATGSSSGQSNVNGGGGGARNATGGAPGGGTGGGVTGSRGQIRITYSEAPPVTTITKSADFAITSNNASYAIAREGTGTNVYINELKWTGQYFAGSHDVNQTFLRFDTATAVPASKQIATAKLILTVPESYGSVSVEVRAQDWVNTNTSSFVAGSALASKTLHGSKVIAGGTVGEVSIDLTGLTRSANTSFVLAAAAQRTNSPTSGDDTFRITDARLEVTVEDLAPIVQVITATGVGSVTVPAGYNKATAEVWSGGQGAQIQKGGDGGNYARSEFAVSSGETFSHSVGAGGVGVSAANRNNGGDTWVGSTSTLIAKGGGIRTGSIGQTVYLGGLGFEEMRGGGGGGAAHPLGAGGNAPTDSEGGSNYLKGGSSGSRAGIIGTGVSNVEGGAGGGGGSNNVAGGAPGGGGGGGYSGTGGTGGRGQIRYTFTYDPTATPSVPARKAPRSATIQ